MVSLSFENPVFLWYLLSIPLLAFTHFYFLRHIKRKAMVFANFEALKRVTKDKLITKNITILIMRIIVLSCVIIASAQTTLWYEGKVSQNDFVIAIDVSASMASEDVQPTRLQGAKDISKHFIDNLKVRSNIGVLGFSSTTFIESTPITNKNTLKKTIDNIEIAKTGGTDISGAIITSTNLLLAAEKGRSMILITDGSNTVGAFLEDSIQNALNYAKENQVVIHTVGIGSESGPLGYLPDFYNISSVYNENVLVDISNQTGGEFFEINDVQSLNQAQIAINDASDTANIPLNLSPGLMLIALCLLFLEWGLISTRFRQVP
jgi:Ca-activated chloride channel family protein